MKEEYLNKFNNYYKDTKEKVINRIKEYNDNLIDEKDNRIIKDLLNDFIELNCDGKYVRATLLALAYNNYKDDDNYLDLACSYETFETAVLVHDDITDKGETRRGKKTIHERVKRKYRDVDSYDFSNSMAMWIGNLVYFDINRNIIDKYRDNKYLDKILDKYNEIVIDTIKGEIIDVDLPFESKNLGYLSKEDDVLDIYRMKTAKYTTLGPYELGLSLLGKDISNNMREILTNIGICFQIKDDILGVFGDSKVIGKPNVSDIEEFKQTILYTYTINSKYKNELLKYYGNKIGEEELEIVRNIFKDSGALEYAENKMNDLIDKSIKMIDNEEELNVDTKSILKGLIIFIQERNK